MRYIWIYIISYHIISLAIKSEADHVRITCQPLDLLLAAVVHELREGLIFYSL